jgi:hypothetical protein
LTLMDPLLQQSGPWPLFSSSYSSFFFFYFILYLYFFSTGNFRSTPPPWSSSSSSPLVRNHTPMREGGCRVCRRVESVSLDFQCFRNEIDDKKSQSHDLHTLL